MTEPWIERSHAYLRHHWTCQICIAAGQGRGERCQAGSTLWAAYLKASRHANLSVVGNKKPAEAG